MFDYKQLFGFAAILFGAGFFLRSVLPAYGLQGPIISTGSNPIKNFYAIPFLAPSTTHTIFSNTSGHDFLVTSYHPPYNISGTCNITVDGNNIFVHSTNNNEQVSGYSSVQELQLLVPAGSTLEMKNYSSSNYYKCSYYIEGHYIH